MTVNMYVKFVYTVNLKLSYLMADDG